MRQLEWEALRQRFQFRCGYCGISERDAGAELTLDHFHPRSRGGLHEPANWVYCCHACNEFKGDWWQPDSLLRVLHPLRDNMASHLVEQPDGMLRALSATGAFHIEKLHLNRHQLVEHRHERRRLDAARQAHTRLLDQLDQLDKELQSLSAQLEGME